VHFLSIVQCAPVREQESRSVSQVWPYSRTVLKSRLRWSATRLREAAFCHRGPVVRLALARGIDRFLIATLDHVDSLASLFASH
jgi:hypothetical protein